MFKDYLILIAYFYLAIILIYTLFLIFPNNSSSIYNDNNISK